MPIPDVPTEMAALAGQWWAHAWQQAREAAHADMAIEHQQLAADRLALDRQREACLDEQMRQGQALAQAQQAEAAAAARLSDIQRLVEQQTAQLTDLAQQRDTLETRNGRLESEYLHVTTRLQAQEAVAVAECETLTHQLRAAEDHGHVEVDRARQESKDFRTWLTAMEKSAPPSANVISVSSQHSTPAWPPHSGTRPPTKHGPKRWNANGHPG